VEEGKRADLVILRANIFELPPEALLSPIVDATILDGEVVAGVSETFGSGLRLSRCLRNL